MLFQYVYFEKLYRIVEYVDISCINYELISFKFVNYIEVFLKDNFYFKFYYFVVKPLISH